MVSSPNVSCVSETFRLERKTFAFSLVELLVVMAIIGIIATLAVPAFNSIASSGSIESSADQIAGSLDFARQTAIARNSQIEVRFYDIPSDGWSNDFRALQLFEVSPSGNATALTKVLKLREPSIVSRDAGLSTLLEGSRRKSNWSAADPKVPLPGVGTGYECHSLRFRPNGATDLPVGSKWHATVVDARSTGSGSQPPANFATVWVEPSTGAVKILRP